MFIICIIKAREYLKMSEKTKKIIYSSIALGMIVVLYALFAIKTYGGLSFYEILSLGVVPFEPAEGASGIVFMFTLMELLLMIFMPLVVVSNVLSLLCDVEVIKSTNAKKIIKLINLIFVILFFILAFTYFVFNILISVMDGGDSNYFGMVLQLLVSLVVLIFAILASKKNSQFISFKAKRLIYDSFAIAISIILMIFMSVAYVDGACIYDYLVLVGQPLDPTEPAVFIITLIGILSLVQTIMLPLTILSAIVMLLCDAGVIKSAKITRAFKVTTTVFASIYFVVSFLCYNLLLSLSMNEREGFGNFALYYSSILLNIALVTFIARTKKIDVLIKNGVIKEGDCVVNKEAQIITNKEEKVEAIQEKSTESEAKIETEGN